MSKEQTMTWPVAGVTFEGRQDIRKRYSGHTATARFKREPENKYDPNAVAVVLGFNDKIGYVKRADAPLLAECLAAGMVSDVTAKVDWCQDLGLYAATVNFKVKEKA